MLPTVPRLRCRGIRKVYPGVVALDEFDLDVAPGSIHAMVGENGAGKSTLVNILAGVVPADEGRIEMDGRVVHMAGARTAQAAGLAVVHQEFNLVSHLSVGENIFLGRWPRRGFGRWVDFEAIWRRSATLLATLGVRLAVRRPVSDLSVAQRQMVEIARALSLNARLLILDEPSAVLTPHELARLFTVIRGLRERGVSVIYISHRLDEIFDLADRVTVLRDGRHIATRFIDEVDRRGLIRDMVGRDLDEEFPPRRCDIGDAVLRMEGLSAGERFADVSLDVRAGEVFGLTGLVGSGRSSLARAVFGVLRPTGGTFSVGGSSGPFRDPRAAIRAGVASLPEDRKRQGLLTRRSVRENVLLGGASAIATAGLLRFDREKQVVDDLMREMRIKAGGCDAPVDTLSGGNQQKVLLARWMSRPHRLVIFDEPTRGVDVGAKVEIYQLINRLASSGVAILLISSELPEVIGMADRIGVMHEGRLKGIVDNSLRDTSQDRVMGLAFGEVPAV
ncbi:MAG: sugar ABC transporter ATP-binding protein [Phycisphaerae bacterium]